MADFIYKNTDDFLWFTTNDFEWDKVIIVGDTYSITLYITQTKNFDLER